jgi:hypothetical protein
LDSGLSFLFTCKDESHPWIAEQVKWGEPKTLVKTEWNGRTHLEHRYRWINGIENHSDGEKLLVNYLCFEMYNREKGKIVYKNSWITNKLITKENVRLPASCARARWKIENENNNVLKNCGYRLEHNVETKFPTDTGRTMPARYIVCIEYFGVFGSRIDDTM